MNTEPVISTQLVLTFIRTVFLLVMGMGWANLTAAQMELWLTSFASLAAIVEVGAAFWIRSRVKPVPPITVDPQPYPQQPNVPRPPL